MTADDEAAKAVLHDHIWRCHDQTCHCTWESDPKNFDYPRDQHNAHVADALAAAGLLRTPGTVEVRPGQAVDPDGRVWTVKRTSMTRKWGSWYDGATLLVGAPVADGPEPYVPWSHISGGTLHPGLNDNPEPEELSDD